jgi:hypothetical protein
MTQSHGGALDVEATPLDARASIAAETFTPARDARSRTGDLHDLCCRIFGWSREQAAVVDEAMHCLLTAARRGGIVVLRGESDAVPIAHALHRRLLGPERAFIVCDPRRREGDGSVRSPPNRRTGISAIEAAQGGSVCIHSHRPPRGFDLLVSPLRGPHATTVLFVCLHGDDHLRDLLCRPLEIPSLTQRSAELDRLIDEYIDEAAQTLGVRGARLSDELRRDILCHATSLADLEKTVLRVIALKSAPSIAQAAQRLDMAPVSLGRWLRRRNWTLRLVAG